MLTNNWIQSNTNAKFWYSVAMSSSGEIIASCINGTNGGIYVSKNYGVSGSWIQTNPNAAQWYSIAMSSSGEYMAACINGGSGLNAGIYVSSSYGDINTWIQTNNILTNWNSIAMSSSGEIMAACINGDSIYISNDYGVSGSWTRTTTLPPTNWYSIAMSSSGQYMTACVYGGSGSNCGIYVSNDSGDNWNQTNPDYGNWISISTSSSGQYMAACVFGDSIYVSNNYGVSDSWSQTNADIKNWTSVSTSSSGQYMAACIAPGYIYVSNNYGDNWLPTNSISATWSNITVSSSGQFIASCIFNNSIGGIYTLAITPCYSILQNYNISLTNTHYINIIEPSANNGGCGEINVFNMTYGYSTNIVFNANNSTSALSTNYINIIYNLSFNDPSILIYFNYTTGQIAIYNSSETPIILNIEITGSFTYMLPSTINPISGYPPVGYTGPI
jgi:hypothetical protein